MIERTKIGECGVDSGTLMIVDPCYCFHDEEERDAVFRSVRGASLFGEAEVPYGFGVVSSTGYGDGVYPVYAETVEDGDWGRRVARIIIECIPEEVGT